MHSHKSGGVGVPLLFARHAVTLPAAEGQCLLTSTKLRCLMTEAHSVHLPCYLTAEQQELTMKPLDSTTDALIITPSSYAIRPGIIPKMVH